MKNILIILTFFLLAGMSVFAQVGINDNNSAPDPSAGLDVNFNNKGLLLPRVTLTALNSSLPITNPAVGLLVYNTATTGTPPNNVISGYYCWNGTKWIPVLPPQGTNPGDMQYWNGAQWVRVPAGSNGQVLTFDNGIPRWVQPTEKPTLMTDSVSAVTLSTALSGGNVSDNGSIVIERGLCWSTSPNPTISDHKTTAGTGTGAFNTDLQGLAPNSTYYVRAYATNNMGTGYGNVQNFSTQSGGIILTTTAISAITAGTANSGGNITDDGGASVTVRGVCWSVVSNPTIADVHTVDGTDTGSYTSNISGLLANTAYFVRAYATNSVGTSYGNELTFTTSPTPVPPTVITTPDTNVNQTSASSGGNVTSGGGALVIFRGVCWNTIPTPTISHSHTTDGSGTGNFVSNLTGLAANTLFYFRAYAVTSSATSYGNELTFTTLPALTTNDATNIAQTTATCGGNISTGGDQPVTSRGVCWATTANPAIDGNHTADGTGTGIFSGSLTGLTGNTLYYVRAYATNSSGTSYGNQKSFTTTPAPPVVTTTEASNILLNTATSGGNVSSGGGTTVTARGVCWNTTPGPTTANSKTSDGTGTGVFVSPLTQLMPNTLYYARAYAVNSVGTAYGNEVTFTTILNQLLPTVTTTAISNITEATAASGGNVTSDGGSTIIFRGVCWSTSPNPTTADSHTTDGNSTGSFVSNLTGLNPNTSFHVRAYAVNSIGTAYGNEVIFSTFASCGSFTINHVAGTVAPVTKTVSYNTITNIPGELTKCWITSNLGSDHQATAVSDATEASAGWYWQYNRKQGYQHDGTTRTPNTTWINSISETYDWYTENDPCNIELGTIWRIPTYTEWYNLDNTGGWTTWAGAWGSGLKLHAAGYLMYNSGSLVQRGSTGNYRSSRQNANTDSYQLTMNSSNSSIGTTYKATGVPVRCVKDCSTVPNAPTSGTHVPWENQITWNWNIVPGTAGYKWSATNNYAEATDLGTARTKTETGLTCNTAYNSYVWAYNACGNSTPLTLSQTTNACFPCGSSFTDPRDNKAYTTVLIGSQCWMAQNLNFGTKINVSVEQTNNSTIEKYCYNNLESNCDIYGGSYQWNEMMQYLTVPGAQGICPVGWHIPTDEEWCTVTHFLDPTVNCGTSGLNGTDAGGKMKSTGTIEAGTGLWISPNSGATNESGFTALPAGSCSPGNSSSFLSSLGYWWSSTQNTPYALSWNMYYDYSKVARGINAKVNGFSVRCLRSL